MKSWYKIWNVIKLIKLWITVAENQWVDLHASCNNFINQSRPSLIRISHQKCTVSSFKFSCWLCSHRHKGPQEWWLKGPISRLWVPFIYNGWRYRSPLIYLHIVSDSVMTPNRSAGFWSLLSKSADKVRGTQGRCVAFGDSYGSRGTVLIILTTSLMAGRDFHAITHCW